MTEQQQLVWDAVERLPENQRTAMVLHYFHDLPLVGIGQIMAAPEGTVKSWLYRAKNTLAGELGETLGELGRYSADGYDYQGNAYG